MAVTIIAEAGVNHNGDAEMARRLIDVAADAGADAVKFQTFKAGLLATATAPKADYQNVTTGVGETQLAMLKRLELPAAWHRGLVDHCRDKGLDFLSTPFDHQSLAFLARDLGLRTLKMASGEITNGPLLLQAGQSGCDIILSTGMSTLQEVEDALAVLAFGFTDPQGTPNHQAFRAAFASAAGRAALSQKVVVLHCTTEYPAPTADTNLAAMATLSNAFGLRTGLSDHTEGIAVPIAAAALGAHVIEKHFTLDRALPGPDHKASLEPGVLTAMIAGVRAVEAALGDGVKGPRPSEMKNMDIARKSLVALRPLRAGEPIGADDLGAKRPGSGISPMDYWDWLGRQAPRDFAADETL
jgi:N-acetylneuraminate synthase